MTFKAFYEQQLIPVLLKLEKRRKRMIGLFLLAVICLALGVWSVVITQLPLVFMLSWLPVLLLGAFLVYRMRRFKSTYKPKVICPIIEFMEESISYEAEQSIEKEQFIESQLFGDDITYYYGEDAFTGKIGHTSFEACELDVRTRSRVRSKTIPVFRGVFVIAKLKQQTPCQLIVFPKERRPYLTRAIKAFVRKGGREVETSDSEKLVVFADSNYAFDHPELKRFLGLIRSNIDQYQWVHASVIGTTICIATTREEDLLEPSVTRSTLDFKRVAAYYNEISQVVELTNALDKIFHKN